MLRLPLNESIIRADHVPFDIFFWQILKVSLETVKILDVPMRWR